MQKTEGRRQKALNRLFCILPSAFSLLVSCTTPAPPPPPVPAPMPPHLTASGVAKRVVLVSFDGLGADEVQRFGAPAFEQMPARVARVIPVEPTATSATHAAILTGETPQKTGIVSNIYHPPGTARDAGAQGLGSNIGVDTRSEENTSELQQHS